jgi:hypothetical protein
VDGTVFRQRTALQTKNFKFRVKSDVWSVGSILGALKCIIDSVERREGCDPFCSCKSPSRTKFEAITFERGFTHHTKFEE